MSLLELIQQPPEARDHNWLKAALQAAVELEFFTIPPYLTAMWSIIDQEHYAAKTIREVVYEEMQHMALACNMLAAIGETPRINRPPAIPIYPRPMPGGVRPDLTIGLSGLTPELVRTFMEIEKPKNPLEFPEVGTETLGATFDTIGDFYEAIRTTFHDLPDLAISVERQIGGPLAPLVVTDLDGVDRAIHLIRSQGEGTDVSPLEDDAAAIGKPVARIEVEAGGVGGSAPPAATMPDLAHYYRFQELEKRRKLQYQESTKDYRWAERLEFPEAFSVGLVPAGGYRNEDVKPGIAADLRAFDEAYTRLLDALQDAWGGGGQAALWQALELMFALRGHARSLMQETIPGTTQTYGPCFRYLGA
jgi:hypothetical protein